MSTLFLQRSDNGSFYFLFQRPFENFWVWRNDTHFKKSVGNNFIGWFNNYHNKKWNGVLSDPCKCSMGIGSVFWSDWGEKTRIFIIQSLLSWLMKMHTRHLFITSLRSLWQGKCFVFIISDILKSHYSNNIICTSISLTILSYRNAVNCFLSYSNKD